VREAIGDHMQMMVDVWALDAAAFAVEAAHAFAPFDPGWFEEPIAGERLDDMAESRRQISMPIVTGERQIGLHHFGAALEKQAADIFSPNIVGVGGLLDFLDIARQAEAHDVLIAPHCWNSTLVGAAAMVHTCAVLPNALIGEYFPQYGCVLRDPWQNRHDGHGRPGCARRCARPVCCHG
tara:strand:- start:843 stop:1382 length:540 start_codon:yes stop_codon:yes gene_type:complete